MPKSKREKREEAFVRQAARDARTDEQQLEKLPNPEGQEATRLRERIAKRKKAA